MFMEERVRNIFVIDDEEPIRKVLNTHLSREGFNVIQSSGGLKVFDHLSVSSFDLVICDITMPEVSGIKILEFVRDRALAAQVDAAIGALPSLAIAGRATI